MSNRIIGALYCPYCRKIKDFFDKSKIIYEWIDSETEEGAKIRDNEEKAQRWSTIPMVWYGGKFIGGCDDFFKALNRKQIQVPEAKI